MMIRAVTMLLAAIVYIGGVADAAEGEMTPSAEQVKFSEAETRLWLSDQLRSIDRTMQITYAFEKSGTLEAGFTDTVKFKVDKVNADGSKAASVEFFTGERNFPVPPAESTTLNPILIVYFQGDVYEMNCITSGADSARERWRYFQRRIKFALAESAVVTPTKFDFDGKTWQGVEISFDPYVNDPHKDAFAKFADKHYSVTVSDALPGYVYRIETHVPGEAGEYLVREVLQLTKIE